MLTQWIWMWVTPTIIVQETNHFSLLSHRVTLAGLKQHFHLHTLLMPKALADKSYWYQNSLTIFGLSPFRVCLDQGHFVFSKAKASLFRRLLTWKELRVNWMKSRIYLGNPSTWSSVMKEKRISWTPNKGMRTSVDLANLQIAIKYVSWKPPWEQATFPALLCILYCSSNGTDK